LRYNFKRRNYKKIKNETFIFNIDFTLVLIANLFGNQFEYFYNGKFYDRIKYIEYKGTKQGQKQPKK